MTGRGVDTGAPRRIVSAGRSGAALSRRPPPRARGTGRRDCTGEGVRSQWTGLPDHERHGLLQVRLPLLTVLPPDEVMGGSERDLDDNLAPVPFRDSDLRLPVGPRPFEWWSFASLR